jgi:hypothetical protein
MRFITKSVGTFVYVVIMFILSLVVVEISAATGIHVFALAAIVTALGLVSIIFVVLAFEEKEGEKENE